MRADKVSSLTSSNFVQPNFKSAIPVAFWERVGKEVRLVSDFHEIPRMQDLLVRRANGTGSHSKNALRERKMVMDLLNAKDRDYQIEYDKYKIPGFLQLAKKLVSSFYPKLENTGWRYGKFYPRVLLMSGLDRDAMKDMGREIGLARKNGSSKEIINKAKEKFADKGKMLISMPTKDELHVIMEKLKNGGYRILKLDMYPPEGPQSPYTIMHYYK